METLLRFVTQKAAKVEAKAVQARLDEEKKVINLIFVSTCFDGGY